MSLKLQIVCSLDRLFLHTGSRPNNVCLLSYSSEGNRINITKEKKIRSPFLKFDSYYLFYNLTTQIMVKNSNESPDFFHLQVAQERLRLDGSLAYTACERETRQPQVGCIPNRLLHQQLHQVSGEKQGGNAICPNVETLKTNKQDLERIRSRLYCSSQQASSPVSEKYPFPLGECIFLQSRAIVSECKKHGALSSLVQAT